MKSRIRDNSQAKAQYVTRTTPWVKVIYGQPYSKANSRKAVRIKGVSRLIKSDAARRYVSDFAKQCPTLDPMFEGDVEVEIEIYYTSRRPDVDESLILDALQKRVFVNDRQVRKKTVTGFVDATNPRAVIRVAPLAACTGTIDP